MTGPLAGVRVVELGGIGPAPHAAMVLADLGADVVRLERASGGLRVGDDERLDHMLRSRIASVVVDLADPAGAEAALELIDRADVLVEGYRPGVAERFGLGPDTCLARNPRLVYGRITGWGREGDLAARAGHDLDYLALTGGLHAIGRPGERPVPPLNLVADFGGGSMLLVAGVLAALVERATSGRGQVVDAAMVDGASLLLQLMWSMRGVGQWRDRPGSNLLDGGAPFYDTYACADGRHVAVAALEPRFYAELVGVLDHAGALDADALPDRDDPRGWPHLRAAFEAAFAARTRDEWTTVFAGTDACVAPVLSFEEAARDTHLRARGTLVEVDGVTQAAPAPRFSRTAPDAPRAPRRAAAAGEDATAALAAVRARWGGEAVSSGGTPAAPR
ncbi:CaiB/BaiF CoA transferase family protein [Agromyces sp. MMS24-K17]|uniref:CaiB/BaiF CoA transferase family protein n=1 Tax=Agromyces sp. MMS24-K17 TaxID=3372850 RepID=UPI003754C966